MGLGTLSTLTSWLSSGDVLVQTKNRQLIVSALSSSEANLGLVEEVVKKVAAKLEALAVALEEESGDREEGGK